MVAAKPPIFFHYLVDSFHFPHRTLTKAFLLSIFKKHSKKIEAVNYVFCSDEYLLELNQKHLQHNYYTDIITFELTEAQQPLLADVYISVDRARENAGSFDTTLQNEILRLLIHGTLHLCGYKDKKPKDIDEMRRQEGYYLNRYLFHVKRGTA
jgi:probable rRNA maturation factor